MHVAVNVVGASRRKSVVLMLRHRCQWCPTSAPTLALTSLPGLLAVEAK